MTENSETRTSSALLDRDSPSVASAEAARLSAASGPTGDEGGDSAGEDVSPEVVGLTVRLFLVRHGETVANSEGLVVGQWDSQLSPLGRRQAAALGRSALVRDTAFWRRYSSDLGRTRETAAYLVAGPGPPLGPAAEVVVDEDGRAGEGGSPNDGVTPASSWILDVRIREIAKGAREEFPKSWDYERAVEERRRRGMELPLLETSDEAWKRIASFISHVLEDACNEFGTYDHGNADQDADGYMQSHGSSSSNSSNNNDNTTNNTRGDENTRRIVNVLVVTHAGTLRTLFTKMTPLAHPTLHHKYDPSHPPDDSKLLAVPNTSVTILDITPLPDFVRHRRPWNLRPGGSDGGDDSKPTTANDGTGDTGRADAPDVESQYTQLWTTRVVEFMRTDHLAELATTSNDG